MTKQRGAMAVALLDILGFRALMAEMDPEELYRRSSASSRTLIGPS